jgi:cell division protein FtsW (lipid II flippase)
MRERGHGFELDWWLLFIVMIICLVGLLEIYSSTHSGPLHGMQWKQLIWIGIGFAGMLRFRESITVDCSTRVFCFTCYPSRR